MNDSTETLWQTIDTYPNDGTPVLGFAPKLRSFGYGGLMVIKRNGPRPFGAESWFTHWMPLPEPPMPTDSSLHTWDGPVPEVERDEDGAPTRPCAGWDWPEDEE